MCRTNLFLWDFLLTDVPYLQRERPFLQHLSMVYHFYQTKSSVCLNFSCPKLNPREKLLVRFYGILRLSFMKLFFTKEQNSAEKQPSSKHISQYRKTVIKKDVLGKISYTQLNFL